MSRLKVLMLTRLFPSQAFPSFGTFCMERAKALAPHAEVRVMVPTPYFPDWMPGRPKWKKWAQVERSGIAEPGIPVSYPRYQSLPGMATWLQGVTMARATRHALAGFEDHWKPDVIDGHFAFPDGYAAVRLARSLSVPSVVTCHGSDLRLYPDIPIAGRMTRWALQTANRVISVSSDLRHRSIELGCPDKNSVLLPNGVDPAKFQLRSQAECRARLNLPVNRKIATQVAALVDVKDHTLALRALAHIRQLGGQPPLLLLVGDGPLRGSLQRQVSEMGLNDDVRFVGQQPHTEVAWWMGAADWLLLTSKAEGWATVYFEAMACGRPVITADVSSARDAIDDPALGTVVEGRTPEAFAQAMMNAMEQTYDDQKLRQQAEQHSWSQWALQAMDVFNAALNRDR